MMSLKLRKEAIVTLVIMMVNGNIGAGLGVAGAFSLIRFRSAPGTARELSGLFTGTAIGLACGMGYVGIAALFFLVVAATVLVLTLLRFYFIYKGMSNALNGEEEPLPYIGNIGN